MPVGLGPLHAVRREGLRLHLALPRFADREVEKIGRTWAITDKIDVYRRVGPPDGVRGDTRHQTGEFVVALNKLSEDRYLPVGPSHPRGGAAHRHPRPEDGAALRLPDLSRAALRPDDPGREAQAEDLLSGREQEPARDPERRRGARGARRPPRGRLSPRDPHALRRTSCAWHRRPRSTTSPTWSRTRTSPTASASLFSEPRHAGRAGRTKTLRWVAGRASPRSAALALPRPAPGDAGVPPVVTLGHAARVGRQAEPRRWPRWPRSFVADLNMRESRPRKPGPAPRKGWFPWCVT